jgi:GDPmannose 4,6-dehydratase
LQALLSLSPRRGEIDVVPDPERFRPIDADLQVPDTAKFRAHTGWEPQIPFATTMRDLLDYWRDAIARQGNAFLTR